MILLPHYDLICVLSNKYKDVLCWVKLFEKLAKNYKS